MNSEIKKIDRELEKLLLKNNNDFLQPKILQKMMFILLISDEEISMEELAKKTKYSLATLSNTIKFAEKINFVERVSHPGTKSCLLYTSPSPRDRTRSRMPSSA